MIGRLLRKLFWQPPPPVPSILEPYILLGGPANGKKGEVILGVQVIVVPVACKARAVWLVDATFQTPQFNQFKYHRTRQIERGRVVFRPEKKDSKLRSVK